MTRLIFGQQAVSAYLVYFGIWPINVNRELTLGLSNVVFVQI
jgi:hypothetical protein